MSKKQSKSKKSTNFKLESKYTRFFSEEFKRTKVKEIQSKIFTIREVCELYQVSRTSVYNWLYKYSNLERGVIMRVEMESETYKTKQLAERNAELERIIGQKQLEIDYLRTTLEIASEELGYDLKKKHGPPSLSNSGKEPLK